MLNKVHLCFALVFFVGSLRASTANHQLIGGVFIQNKGQVLYTTGRTCSDVLFKIENSGIDAYLKNNGITYLLNEQIDNTNYKLDLTENDISTLKCHRIDVDFVNALVPSEIITSDPVEGYTNYFLGDISLTDVHSFKKIQYKNIYKRIDVAFHGISGDGVKYDFIVKPEGNYRDIQLEYKGANNMLLQNGKLIVKTSVGDFIESMPRVYQVINGKIIEVKAEYSLEGNNVKFKIGTYHPSYDLIIDPWATYFGGSRIDDALAVTTDALGNVIVCGYTHSLNLPVTPGAFQLVHGSVGINDAFVVKFNSLGQRLWATYFGGNGGEHARDLVTDLSTNDIYVAGGTGSTNFFTTTGAYKSSIIGGSSDAFVARLNAAGTITWSTLYGNTVLGIFHSDMAHGVDIDAFGNVYITGSSSGDLPVMPGAFQVNLSGPGTLDAFVAKFSPAGAHLWSTYCGGLGVEEGCNIAVDGFNNVIVAGYTDSQNFPVALGAQMAYGGGNTDAFLIKFNSSGARIWCTYLGGSLAEGANVGFGLDVDQSNNIIIGGETESVNFPVTAGAYQFTYGGAGLNNWGDGFITKYSPAGAVLWSTFLGGSNAELLSGLAINSSNHIFVKGQTQSVNFPTTNCSNSSSLIGGTDLFITQFDPSGNLVCSGLTGGTSSESSWYSNQIAVSGGDVFTVGVTYSTNFPVTTGAFQMNQAGQGDAYIVKTCEGNCGINKTQVAFSALQQQVCTGVPISFINNTVQIGNCKMANTGWSWTFTGAAVTTSTEKNPQNILYNNPGVYPVKLVVKTGCGDDSLTLNNYITVNATPVIALSNDTSICSGSNVTLIATGANGYLWNNAAITPSINISPVVTTTYSVIGASAAGLCFDTAFVTVTVNPLPSINIQPNPLSICVGASVQLSATGALNYQWSPAVLLNTATGAVVNPTPTSSTIFSVTGIDANGCSNSSTVNVTVNPLPTIIINPSAITICSGASTSLTATGGASYLWSPVNTTGAIITVSPTVATVYTVIGTDANGCTNTAVSTVNLAAPLQVVIPSGGTICEGNSTTLSANASGGTGIYTYNWLPIGVNTSTVSVAPNATTTYSLTLTDNCSTPTTATVTVSVNALPVPTFTTDKISGCPDLCINFTNTTANTQLSTWIFGDGNSSSSNNPNNCYNTTGVYSVSLTVTDNNGCSNTLIQSNYITVHPVPEAKFTSSPNPTTIIEPTIRFTDESTNNTTWDWKFGDELNGTSNNQHPSYTYNDTGSYTVRLIVNNEFGCADTAYDVIRIKQDYILYIPNTFTPNNDGMNEKFIPVLFGVVSENYELYIYDRWGTQIFKTTNPQQGWDGIANNGNNIAQQDVYVWKLMLTDVFGKKHHYDGHVNLLR